MVKKLEVEFQNYREDENEKVVSSVYCYSIKLSDNFITDIIITDKITVDDNDNLTEIVNEIVKKIRATYGKDIIK